MLPLEEIFAGRYRIRGQLAQGGMSVIYAAEHLVTEERVALKVLFPHVLDAGAALESFQLEARLNARIGSEHIVRILDAGVDEKSGVPFLAMELLRGATLRAIVSKQGPLSRAEVVLVLRQVAKALDRAHGYVDPAGHPRPIVHRDLKPENIFVTAREGGAVVKVLDFGIAKVLSDIQESSRGLRGTPLFMAYEQFGHGPVTPRLDLWPLGLIAFYLLTGRRYWLSTARGGEDICPLLNEILVQPLAPPTARARELGHTPTWTSAFDGWFFRCVNRNPAARFGSAGMAAEALETSLAGGPLPRDELAAARARLTAKVVAFLDPATAVLALREGEATYLSDQEAPPHREGPPPLRTSLASQERAEEAPLSHDHSTRSSVARGAPAGEPAPPRSLRVATGSAVVVGILIGALAVLTAAHTGRTLTGVDVGVDAAPTPASPTPSSADEVSPPTAPSLTDQGGRPAPPASLDPPPEALPSAPHAASAEPAPHAPKKPPPAAKPARSPALPAPSTPPRRKPYGIF
jgi:eukaryotic-like serine/threonine-protein kinase